MLWEMFKEMFCKLFFIALVFTLIIVLVAVNIGEYFQKFSRLFILCAFIGIFILLIKVMAIKAKYSRIFVGNMINKLLKNLGEDLVYQEEYAKMKELYENAEFKNFPYYNSFHAIIGSLNGKNPIKMATVSTYLRQGECEEVQAVADKIQYFNGVFVNIESLQKFETIKIRNNSGILEDKTMKIEINSENFSKYFEVYAEGKREVMQILTSELMSIMIEFTEKTNIQYEVTIKEKQIYIGFYTGYMFDSNILSISKIDYNPLAVYYYIFDFISKFTKKLEEIGKSLEA